MRQRPIERLYNSCRTCHTLAVATARSVRWNPYAGAVGYFSFSGNMDFCITIRTMVMKGKTVFFQAGAGIVADSNPEREYHETVNKAKAMAKAIEMANEGLQ